ncbi:hypothetical protein QBC38DRAFT_20207 [Podospora fimiseda]|uniref:Uncharacterized protein n=1 Tax=Podospora fimiseda TaxID=252190 RepID=A0AAN7BW42_9PEZI|nr:hypothetical protein QBC38DRAFT_20207 [Podospora fimiseda]
MSGPTLTMMAPAVEPSTPLAVHRSASMPAPAVTPPVRRNATPVPLTRANTDKALPKLPVQVQNFQVSQLSSEFEIPAFEFSSTPSLDLSLELEKSFASPPPPLPPPAPRAASVELDRIQFAAESVISPVEKQHTRNRSRSMIDPPASWLPSSKSTPNIPTTQELRPTRLAKNNVVVSTQEATQERSRSVETFADFAKRSWISKNRTPSSPDTTERRQGFRSRETSTERKASALAKAKTRATTNDTPRTTTTTTNIESTSSASRVLGRASAYLSRIKQKPQSVFGRNSSPLSVSTPAPVKSSKPSEPDNSSPIAASPILTPPTPKASVTINTARPTTPTPARPFASVNNAAPFINASLVPSRTSSNRSSSIQSDTDNTTASTASENTSQSTANTSITMPHPTSRDPLWATFRTVDLEFANFAAKDTTAARMTVVRSILAPFLRSTAHHPSNSSRAVLSSEDLDRRATILNKWWNGLLSMLDAGNSRLLAGGYGLAPGIAALGVQFPILQPIAGVDRPMLLEAATMIMMRPEWRACTSHFQPLADRSPEEKVRARSATVSTVGSDSDCLVSESAEHNVRTMFVNNLTTQMALVVEKMSMRHAPLSLVNWCGKACAYAFFFVPGIADVLVRLWGLNADLLRRVSDEFGLPRRSKGESEDIVALYPLHLHKLGWSSVKTLADKLRLAAKLPLMPAKIPWHGPWVSRWRGGDTDLFFIFCKYFYVLSEEFVPEGLPLVEKARSPAFVLVHAQILSILDSTVHRQASLDAMMGPPMSEGLHGVDASLTGLPVPSNLLKGMDENRLVVMLKDVLSEDSFGVSWETKHTFAEAFAAITKAAAKRTPRFEHAGCFMLCDFLEEALVILDAFQNLVNDNGPTSPTMESAPLHFFNPSEQVNYIDWRFWLEVGKMIADSNNTMSEIRILSFIYSVWDALTSDPVRKEALCLEWLLSEEFFAKFFNHWCPMVRAYYMRLLCWRICRDSGSASEVNNKIFQTVAQRLKTFWAHYLWLKQDAEIKGKMYPSTAPCHPTPGKRFLIIRTEVHPPQAGTMRPAFDSCSGAFSTPDPMILHAGNFGDSSTDISAKDDGNVSSFKKRLSLLGKVLPFSGSPMPSPQIEPHRTWDEELELARREAAAARFGRPGPPAPPKQQRPPLYGLGPSSESISSTGSAPLYDAVTFVFRFALTWQTGPGGQPMPLGPSRDRILTRPRLPAPAQSRVSARSLTQGNVGNNVFRSESPPPIAPGLPPETRRFSGVLQTGLISEARNARPLHEYDDDNSRSRKSQDKKRPSLSVRVTPLRMVDGRDEDSFRRPSFDGYESDNSQRSFHSTRSQRSQRSQHSQHSYYGDGVHAPAPVPAVRAERPTGVYSSGAVYCGRALAEWSIIVNECNSFVDRRRDEGVLGLSDVEVPILSVDGLGARQRG